MRYRHRLEVGYKAVSQHGASQWIVCMRDRQRDIGARQLEGVKVIEEERLAVDEHLPFRREGKVVLIVVPRSDSSAKMLEHDHAAESRWPIIEIQLVPHLALFVAYETPFKATFPPPSKRGESMGIATEGEQADIVAAVMGG